MNWLTLGLGAVGVIILIVAFWAFLRLFLRNVGPSQLAIKQTKYRGKPMPAGRVVAMKGEVGIQAEVLLPGLHVVPFPIQSIYDTADFVEIGADELGIVEAIDGQPLPDGRIFAPDPTNNAHENFQNPVAFLEGGGFKGIQMLTLPPGKWPIHPYLFRVSICKVFEVRQGMVGLVTAADGAALDPGRILGKAVEGHNHFQDAGAFIAKGGQKGQQVEILPPGTYRIFRESVASKGEKRPGMFTVTEALATVVPENKVGLVDALDGASMDGRDFVAPEIAGHDNFQNGQAFLGANGQRGPQMSILRPGTYYINTMLFKVTFDDAKIVKPGECAVIVSNCGNDPNDEIRAAMSKVGQELIDALIETHREELNAVPPAPVEAPTTGEGDGTPIVPQLPVEKLATDVGDRRLHEGGKEAYVVPSGFRGIQKDVVGPGRYYVNTFAVTPSLIPTTNLTVEWSKSTEKGTFDPFEVVSKDGFRMEIEVMAVFRIRPADAPFMVAKIGGVEQLIERVMHPTIDSIFRNQASSTSAMNYLQNRQVEQVRAEQAVRFHLIGYHVEVVNVLIRHIHLPESLMETQTAMVIAKQNEGRYAAEQSAQDKRKALMEATAQADQQAELVRAKVGVQIAEEKASQRKKEGQGEADYIQQTGDATAAVKEKTGRAEGAAFEAQVAAMGREGVALVTAIKALAEAGTVITPQIVAGGGADGGGGLGSVLLGLLVDKMRTAETATGESSKAA